QRATLSLSSLNGCTCLSSRSTGATTSPRRATTSRSSLRGGQMHKVYIVGAGPGAPDLITVRGMDLLRRADVLIYAGSLVNPALVEESPARLKLDSWGMRLEEIVDAIEEHVRAGELVVRLHSGDPALYGAIVEQMAELERRGIEAEIVP